MSGSTCRNPAYGGDGGNGDNLLFTAATLRTFLVSWVNTAVAWGGGHLLWWLVAGYVGLAFGLVLVFWALSLVQYMRDTYRAATQGVLLRKDAPISLLVLVLWFLCSLISAVVVSVLWPVWFPFVVGGMLWNLLWRMAKQSLWLSVLATGGAARWLWPRLFFWHDSTDRIAQTVQRDPRIQKRVQKLEQSMLKLGWACHNTEEEEEEEEGAEKPPPPAGKRSLRLSDLDELDRMLLEKQNKGRELSWAEKASLREPCPSSSDGEGDDSDGKEEHKE